MSMIDVVPSTVCENGIYEVRLNLWGEGRFRHGSARVNGWMFVQKVPTDFLSHRTCVGINQHR